jgi:hypothetical protein
VLGEPFGASSNFGKASGEIGQFNHILETFKILKKLIFPELLSGLHDTILK